ncbi:MAG: hypothetical protein M3Y79_15620 [Pseudomonadota bacterium]|nr:hypothetical protein [Pseudomonadota bacterium]
MDIEQRLRASLVAPDPGPAFTARVMSRLHPRAGRRGGRFIVIGIALAMAAAAGMLAWHFSLSGQARTEEIGLPGVGERAYEGQWTATTAAQQVPAETLAPVTATPSAAPAPFSVILLSPRQEVQDADLHDRVEAFHAAMGEELRRIPGLTLRVSSQFTQEAGDDADFIVSLTSSGPLPTSGGEIRPADGGNAYPPPGLATGAVIGNVGRSSGDASRGAASTGADAMNGLVSTILATRMAGLDVAYNLNEFAAGGGSALTFSDERGTITGVSGDGSIVSQTVPMVLGAAGKACWVEIRVSPRKSSASRYRLPVQADASPAQLAAALVGKLRLQVLPLDAGYQQRVLARLGNAEMDGSLLPDLLPLLVVDGGKRLETPTRQALFRFVANQPAVTRAKVWKALNRADNPSLVGPMLDSLREDPDHQVRLAALANLEAKHAGNPAVREAFQALEQREAEPFMRAALRWTLYGENQWRADVMSALQDAGLSYEARLAPLIARTTADASSFQMSQKRRSLVEQERVLQPLLSLIGENLHDPDREWVTSEALRLLSSVEHPSVEELFLSLLRETSLPTQVNGKVRTWAVDHWADPRVREALGR